MTSEERAENQALSERLTKYADTIVTASIVAVVGLGFGIADADIRPSLARGSTIVTAVSVVVGLAFLGVLVLLRRWELVLKADIPSEARSLEIGRYLHAARVVIVGLSLIASIALALEAR